VSAIEEVIRARPSADACYDLSVMYGREGRLADARRACDEALRLDPSHPQALALRRVLTAAGER
jgi:Flp pilus assembly protein TadD